MHQTIRLVILQTFFIMVPLLHSHVHIAVPFSYKEKYRNYSNSRYSPLSAKKLSPLSIPLDKHIHLFSQCLVHLINYKNLNFLPLPSSSSLLIPVVTSRYTVVQVTYELKPLNIISFTKTQSRVYSSTNFNFNNATKPIPYCTHYNSDFQCYDFPSFDVTSSSKPWRCEANLYLYPPGPIEDPVFYEWDEQMNKLFLIIPGSYKSFFYDSFNMSEIRNNDTMLHINPHPQSMVKGLIISRAQYNILLPEVDQNPIYFRLWTNSLTITRKGVFKVDFAYTPSKSEMFVDLGNSRYIWLCRYCTFCSSIGAKLIEFVKDIDYLDGVIFKENAENIGKILWNTQVTVMFRRSIEKVSRSQTGKTREYFKLRFLYKRFKDHGKLDQRILDKLRFDVEAMLLKSALVNLTSYSITSIRQILYLIGTKSIKLQNNSPFPCSSTGRFGVDPGIHTFASGNDDYFHFHFHPSRLKFVSCGSPTHTTLFQAFCQLISIFDLPIWVGISVSVFSVGWCAYGFSFWYQSKYHYGNIVKTTSPTAYTKSLNSVFSSVLCFLKILFEQGDPINLRLISHHSPIRLLFGAFLIIGIVLSNAFKNENITHVTLPRQPIPYDDLDTLNLTGFKIYTRGTIYWVQNKLPGLFSLKGSASPFYGNYSNNQSIKFRSELSSYGKGETSVGNMEFLLLSVTGRLSNRIVRVTNFTNPNLVESAQVGTEYDVMKECNYTALFLPDVEANAMYYRLKREGKSAFLGEHLGLNKDHGLMFFRWVNPAVLERLKGLYAGGLYGWWTDLLVNVVIRIRGGFMLETEIIGGDPRNGIASDMEGNISVVFMILAIGIFIAFVVFCGELRKKVGMCLLGLLKKLNFIRKRVVVMHTQKK